MARDTIPTYNFKFNGGLSKTGNVKRMYAGVDGVESDRIDYCLNDLPLASSFGRQVPVPVADLIDVSTAIYVSDRLALRERIGDLRPAHDRWHRRIHVAIPVRCPDLWRRPEIVECLGELLAFLTDDRWTFEFTQRLHSPRQSEVQVGFLIRPSHPSAVILNSGGLDSFIGILDRLATPNMSTVIPVTVIPNRRIYSVSQAIIQELREAVAPTAPLLLPTYLRIDILRGSRSKDDREPSHRARAMLFLAAGACASILADEDRLFVCENGIGAIGLPMSSDHWGARSSRAMHPKTLALFSRLTSLALNHSFEIKNIGEFATKGELVRTIHPHHYAAAQLTVTCDHASYLRYGEACGVCTSCILRRVALIAGKLDAEIDGYATTYKTDLFDSLTQWDRKNITQLATMRRQVELLRDIQEQAASFTQLLETFPEAFDVVLQAPYLEKGVQEVERELLRMFQAHVREFDEFVTRIDRPGWGHVAFVSNLIPATKIAAAV